MKTFKSFKSLLALLLVGWTCSSQAAIILDEGFDDIGNLAGWQLINNSVPAGQPWFQGNAGLFGAYSGATDSYIAANFLSASGGFGNIDNWLLTPELTLSGTTLVSFYTRSANTPGYGDTLELRFGDGTNPVSFTQTLLTVGGTALYPNIWTLNQASVDFTGSGRFAFHYVGDAAASDYIGIDSVSVAAVPEASTWAMMLAGLGLIGFLRRKHNKKLAGALALSFGALGTFGIAPQAMAEPPMAEPAGMIAVRDAETGQLRAPTPAEAQALRSQSQAQARTAAPARATLVRKGDGSRKAVLGSDRQVYAVIERDADGQTHEACVTGAAAAAAATDGAQQ